MTPLSWSVISDALDSRLSRALGRLDPGTPLRRAVRRLRLLQHRLDVGAHSASIRPQRGATSSKRWAAPKRRRWSSPAATASVRPKIQWRKMLRQIPTLLGWLRDQDQLPKVWPAERQSCEDERDRLKALDTDALSDREIFRELSRSSAESERQTLFLMRAQSAVFSAAQGLLWATDRWLGANRRNLVLSVIQGLPGVRTQEGNIALRRVGQRGGPKRRGHRVRPPRGTPPASGPAGPQRPPARLDLMAARRSRRLHGRVRPSRRWRA